MALAQRPTRQRRDMATATAECADAAAVVSSSASSPPPPPRTSPPSLSVLSWSVDATAEREVQRYARRLPFAARLPHIVAAVCATAADVVALQDSTKEVAAALCATPQVTTAGITAATTTAADAAAAGDDDTTRQARVRYTLVGAAHNGRCGVMQLFVRDDSPWRARLLPTAAGVTAELTWHGAFASARAAAAATSDASSKHESSTSAAEATAAAAAAASVQRVRPVRCVVTVVDLSYRGKSLGVAGQLLTSAHVSRNGSPLLLQQQQPPSSHDTHEDDGDTTAAAAAQRRDIVDEHRLLALEHVAHATHADIVVGNVYLPSASSLPLYDDAWVLAGAPSSHAHTTNTLLPLPSTTTTTTATADAPAAAPAADASAEQLRRSNYYYYVPTPQPLRYREQLRRRQRWQQGQLRHDGDDEGSSGGNNVDAGDRHDGATRVAVGAQLPLSACRASSDMWQLPPHTAHASAASTDDTTATRGEQQQQQDEAQGAGDAAADEGVGNDGNNNNTSSSSSSWLDVREVLGRHQRCLVRKRDDDDNNGGSRRGGARRGRSTFAHLCRRVRVRVLRPWLAVELSASEAAWHAQRMQCKQQQLQRWQQQRRRGRQQGRGRQRQQSCKADAADEVAAAAAEHEQQTITTATTLPCVQTRVHCAPAEQFPLLTQFVLRAR